MGKGPTWTKIFIAALFCGGQELKIEEMQINWGMTERVVVYMNVMENYCVIRNDELVDFRKTWKDLYELMLSEMSRTRRILCTVTATLHDD